MKRIFSALTWLPLMFAWCGAFALEVVLCPEKEPLKTTLYLAFCASFVLFVLLFVGSIIRLLIARRFVRAIMWFLMFWELLLSMWFVMARIAVVELERREYRLRERDHPLVSTGFHSDVCV